MRNPGTDAAIAASRQPPLAGPLPKSIELVLGDGIYIAKDPLPPGLRNRLAAASCFQNPEFYKAQAMRLPTYGKPRHLLRRRTSAARLLATRLFGGCPESSCGRARQDGYSRRRRAGVPLDVRIQGELRPEQQAAACAMLAHDTGVLAATTAFGKTVIAAWLIAERRVNTLVLVHRRQLLEQWVERLSTFLGLLPKAIGHIGGGRTKPTGMLDVAVMQSLVRRASSAIASPSTGISS